MVRVPRYGGWIVAGAALIGVAAAAYLASRGLTNLYGDGIAHLNIARKMVDTRDAGLWERYVQLGSPWLPLTHVAMLPFVWLDGLWRSGWAGTIPSLLAYVGSAWFLYRLALSRYESELAAVLTVAVFALNPSVLFMASTPMTELVFVAFVLLSAFLLEAWREDGARSRVRIVAASIAVAALTLVRYEGWAIVPAGAVVVGLCTSRPRAGRIVDVALFLSGAALGPVYWLWHNWAIFGDPLWFYRGPNSARAIYAQQESHLGWTNFVVGSPIGALGWALLVVAVVAGPTTVAAGLWGFANRIWTRRRELLADAAAALVLVPFAFLALSLFRGEVQIYPLAAVGLLNVRYGVPHVAAVALLVPAAAVGTRRRRIMAIIGAAIAIQYAVLVAEGPTQLAVCQEATRNSRNAALWRGRAALAEWIAAHPPTGTVLMNSGDLGPVIPAGGLRFRQVIHEGTHEWNAWYSSKELPAEVSTVVCREEDDVWKFMQTQPDVLAAFVERYHENGLVVWTRRSGEG